MARMQAGRSIAISATFRVVRSGSSYDNSRLIEPARHVHVHSGRVIPTPEALRRRMFDLAVRSIAFVRACRKASSSSASAAADRQRFVSSGSIPSCLPRPVDEGLHREDQETRRGSRRVGPVAGIAAGIGASRAAEIRIASSRRGVQRDYGDRCRFSKDVACPPRPREGSKASCKASARLPLICNRHSQARPVGCPDLICNRQSAICIRQSSIVNLQSSIARPSQSSPPDPTRSR